jgi:selenocysteine-specific elongation factor
MTEKHFVLATAGHVDHGKSTLVKALTGTDPDRLPEEKARGITIDLGFAELNVSEPNREKIHLGIVDVPGHEDFVRNMIAGVGSIDLALLVVAADDGWMPQTEEHLQILTYLGIKRIVVAVTKSDLGSVETVAAQVRERLKESVFSDCRTVAVSVHSGEGLENIKSAIASESAKLATPRDIGKPRLFVDRAFTLRGIGTVVTGTLTGGSLRVGDKIFVQPKGISSRIRSLQTHGRSVDLAQAGTRTAINLPDLALYTDVRRGDVISSQPFEPSSTLDVFLTCSSHLQRAMPIKSRTSAWVHHGTTRVLAKIVFSETDSLRAGESAVARLRLKAPLFAFVGDRLIVRDASEQHTIAGAVVFNIDSTGALSTRDRVLLATRAVAPDDVALAVWTEISSNGVIESSRLLERSRFSPNEISTALRRLSDHGEIFLSENVCAKMLVWRDLREQTAKVIDAGHKTHPERRGVELNELRAELKSISAGVFDELIVDLCREDFARVGSAIARRTHRASLPPELKAAADKIRAALGEKSFDPPGRKDFSQDRQLHQAIRFLIEQGEIVEVGEEIVLLRGAVDRMRAAISEFISTNGPATASQLREKIGTSRRVIIPFLEYLDRSGVTRRVGDQRVLAK